MNKNDTRKRLRFTESNNSQNYATHSFFRYFGKLPPVVINHILDFGLEKSPDGLVVDLMCGSGTSIVESMLRGSPSIGVDVNPLSALVTKVKTTLIPADDIRNEFEVLRNKIERDLKKISDNKTIKYIANETSDFPNKEYWFTKNAEKSIVCIKHYVNQIEQSDLKDFFLVALLSIIRRISNASPRTGRIFHIGKENDADVYTAFNKKVEEMILGLGELQVNAKTEKRTIICSDARKTSLDNNIASLVIAHPPYFALYKYSSDVLRFELEWAGIDRKKIVKSEIQDGFKTTKIETFEDYVSDMKDIFAEAQRILLPNHMFCLIVSDSTLGDTLLPCVERLSEAAEVVGLEKHEHFVRDILFAQATYHRSSRSDKITTEDHIIFFRKK
jgi:hypothetical protein